MSFEIDIQKVADAILNDCGILAAKVGDDILIDGILSPNDLVKMAHIIIDAVDWHETGGR